MMRYPERSKQVQDFVRSFISEKGYSPTVREIAAAVGASSPGHIQPILQRMIAERLLAGEPTMPRTIRLGDAIIEPRTEVM